MTKTLKDILSAAGKIPKKDFFVTETAIYTYGDLIDRVGKIHSFLQQNGIVKNDRMLVSVVDDYDTFCITLSLLLSGVTVVLIEPDAKFHRANGIVQSVAIDGYIVDKDKVEKWNLPQAKISIGLEKKASQKGLLLKKLLKNRDESGDNLSLQDLIATYEPTHDFPELATDQEGVIIFTSGTTSDPKGVVLSHGNICSHLQTLSIQYGLKSHSVISNILPMYHADGLFQGPFLSLYSQATLSRPFAFEVSKIEDLFHSIYKYRVSHFFVVPTILALMKQLGAEYADSFETDDFKYVISGAGYLDPTLWEGFSETFNVRVVNVYGLTETVAGGLFCGPDKDSYRIGSIGKPSDIEVMIIDDKGQQVKGEGSGELALRGENVMKSYLKPSGNPDNNGWFLTGDLVSKDSDGYYYIKGRKKHIVIKGGINIYPEELIEILTLHDGIAEAYVYGEKHDVWGEKLIAVIVKNSHAAISQNDVMEYCREKLSHVAIPDEVFFVDALPKGISGKVVLEEVKSLLEHPNTHQSSEGDPLQVADLLDIARDCFGTKITEDQIHLPSHAIQGWNSLEHLHFVSLIEKSYGIELSTKDIMNITSIATAESIITYHLKSKG